MLSQAGQESPDERYFDLASASSAPARIEFSRLPFRFPVPAIARGAESRVQVIII